MAINATLLTTSGNAGIASSYNYSSITPSANQLVIAFIANNLGASPGTASIAGNSLTWVQVGTAVNPAVNRVVTVFRALSSSPTAGSGTISYAAGTEANCSWSIFEFSGVDTSGANGANAVLQPTFGSGAATDTNFKVILGGFGNANNATSGVLALGNSGPGTAGANFIGLGTETASITQVSEWASTNVGTVDWNYASTSVSKIAFAFEVVAAPVTITNNTYKTLLGAGNI